MIKNLKHFLLAAMTFGFAACNNDENSNITGGQITITSISITEVSRGQQNAEATIVGTNFSGTTSVNLGDGITVNSVNNISSTEVRIVFSVDINTSAGPRTITVTTTTSTATAASLLEVLSNRVPVAKFTVDPPAGSTATTFTFDASNSTDPDNNLASYSWNFGSAGTAQGKKVTKKFNAIGDYLVTLTVNDHSGAYSSIERGVEILKNSPPVARIKVTPGEGSTLTNFEFDGSGSTDPDGRIVSYEWRFGDGERAQGMHVSHTFENGGTFDVELTVTDNKGQDGSQEKSVEVEKAQGSRCSPRNVHQGPAHVFDVVSADRGSRTIVARFRSNAGCQPFTRCGDIRLGGYPGVSPGTEHWIGVMCEFTDLGNGMAVIKVDGGNYWPSAGQRNFYAWPQECNIPGICRN